MRPLSGRIEEMLAEIAEGVTLPPLVRACAGRVSDVKTPLTRRKGVSGVKLSSAFVHPDKRERRLKSHFRLDDRHTELVVQ